MVPDENSDGHEEKNFEIHFVGKTHIKMIDLNESGPPIVLKRAGTDKKKEATDQKKD